MKNPMSIFIKLLFSLFALALLVGGLTLDVKSGRASTVITVNSKIDSVANDGNCTLREAIIAANRDKKPNTRPGECPAGSNTDTIILPNTYGDYVLTRADNGKEDASVTGDLDIVDSVIIKADGPGVKIVGVNGDHVFHVLSGQVTIEGLTITGGNLSMNGGGIRNESQLTLKKVTMSGNRAGGNGGGIYNAPSGVLTVANSTLSGNQAGGLGGGLYNDGTMYLNNVTIAANTAVNGLGIANGAMGVLNIQNTIVAGNSNNVCSGTLTSGGHNLIQNASGCTINGDTGTNLTGVDPILGTLGDNGGNTFTYEPGEGSPAIDAGSPLVPGSGGNACEQTDQRGTYRPHGDTCDIGAVEVGTTNVSILIRAFSDGGPTTVVGRLSGAPGTNFYLQFYTSTNPDAVCFTSAGGTPVGDPVQVTTDSDGNVYFTETIPAIPQDEFIVATTTDLGGFSSDYSQCVRVGAGNDSWPNAMLLNLDGYPNGFAQVDQSLDLTAQSRWYKFNVEPHSKVVVTLTNLPANYDLTVHKDIELAYASLTSNEDLQRLGAEFATDSFSTDSFSTDSFSTDSFSTDSFSTDSFSALVFSTDSFSTDSFSTDSFSTDSFSTDSFSTDSFSTDSFSTDSFSTDVFSPTAFSSAQTRSLIAVSAFDGQVGEGILVNTWDSDTYFYVRVHGRNGAFNPVEPFHLEVRQYSGICSGVNEGSLDPSSLVAEAGGYKTVILTNLARMQGTLEEKALLLERLQAFANPVDNPEVSGVIVDVSQDARVADAYAQSDANPDCPAAQNYLAKSIKQLVDKYWDLNPLEYVVIVGGDDVIPFFRHPDHAMLASEQNYAPPVLNGTISQSSLRLGNVLSQDDYGAGMNISYKDDELPIPQLGVGRLVETASEATTMLDAYLSLSDGVVVPSSFLATGYDFLEDTGLAVLSEFQAGGGAGGTYDSLITPNGVSPLDRTGISPNDPMDPYSWNADELRDLLLAERHDLIFLAGHFSGNSALAADFNTRILAEELANTDVDMRNAIIFSAGCHVGYNIIDPHAVPNLTRKVDWGQAAATKGITLIGGTGYQYGDTDFIMYSEEIYREFSRQLRVGTGPVSVGQALVRAKQAYLADTPYLRGIDEKAVLEATIFGLPMLSVNFPGERLSDSGELSIVPLPLEGYDIDPGYTLGLTYADINVDTPTTMHTVELEDINDPLQTTTTYYFSGEDGIVVKPHEPSLPKQIENVSVDNTVLRGVGFRSGTYSNLPDVVPYTGAAATEIRGIHAPFLSPVYFPQKLFSTNYFAALADGGNGITNLFLYPAQYRSSSPSSLSGTWRTFQDMGFRLFYSNDINTYGGGSVPALAAAPTIAVVSSQVSDSQVDFRIHVVGNPAAGIAEVWVTFTDITNPVGGSWQSLDLVQNQGDSTLWEGTLVLPFGVTADQIRYIVQAVNGVGLVSMSTNQGYYYVPGLEAGPSTPTQLTFVDPVPTSGRYTTKATLSARLTSNNMPMADQAVVLSLGPQSRLGITNQDGIATAEVSIYGIPGESQTRASFAGVGDYQASYAEAPFTIEKQRTKIKLDPQPASGYSTDSAIVTATLSDTVTYLLSEETLIFYVSGAGGTYGEALITDYAGSARLGNIPLPPGSYTVNVYFSGEITPFGLSLSDNRYEPSVITGTLYLSNTEPVAADDVYQVNEDETLVVSAPGVLGNDSDFDNQLLSAVLESDVAHGTLNLNADGSFTYVPDPNYNGIDSFTYAAYDGFDSVSATVSITVNAINDVPLAVDDAYSVNEDEVLNVPAPGVLSNDLDVDGDVLVASLVSGPSSGTLTFNPDGSFSYTPLSNFNGLISFTYQVSDGVALSNVATVTITVVSVNDPPNCTVMLNMDSLWPANNQYSRVTLSGATDPDGDVVTINIVSIFQDEPVGPQPDAIIYGNSADIRAERDGYGDGRVYHISYEVWDSQGGMCGAEVLIGVVAHDQSGNLGPVDQGPLYDSTIAQ